jgi:hypothetical protein
MSGRLCGIQRESASQMPKESPPSTIKRNIIARRVSRSKPQRSQRKAFLAFLCEVLCVLCGSKNTSLKLKSRF